MPPTAEDRLRDILEAIAEIEDVMQGPPLKSLVERRMRASGK
jgi:hypothetical protein